MKKILNITALLICSLAAAAQSDFTIAGHIGSLNAPTKIYLDYRAGNYGNSDSTTLVNGNFKFSGKIKPYSSARITLDHKGIGKDRATHGDDVIYIYMGPGNMIISSKDSLRNATITGCKIYDEYAAYAKAVGPMPWDIDRISNAEIAAAPQLVSDTAFTNQVARHHWKMIADFQANNLKFAKEHPDSYFAPVALFGTASDDKTVLTAEQVFKKMSPQVQASDAGKTIQEFIDAHYRLKVGAAAPVFTQVDVSGKPVSLSSYKGKIILIDFWASWCSPCRQEIPNIIKQYKQYKDKGFEILSVSLDNSRANWTKAIAQEGMAWPQLSDLKGNDNAVAKLYGVSAIPATFLVDREGKLISTGLRGEELNKKLAELFAN